MNGTPHDMAIGAESCRTVVFVIYPGCQILDLAGPHEVFATANDRVAADAQPTTDASPIARRVPYRIEVRSNHQGSISSESGLTIGAPTPLGDPLIPIDTLLVVGGAGVHEARNDQDLVQWIKTAATNARRVGAVCTGAFLLAEAGLLDGRRATTHWARAQRLAREFPAVHVDPDPIHIDDAGVWTSAGVTAGIDLALALVEADHGPDLAQTIGQWLVMFLRRPGGQSQFAPPMWNQATEHNGIRSVIDRIHADPGGEHSVAALATTAAMSVRNFGRVFARETGTSPARYVEQIRVAAARSRLEQSRATTDVIAAECGLGTAETMRRAFLRTIGVTPGAYRRRFTHAPQINTVTTQEVSS